MLKLVSAVCSFQLTQKTMLRFAHTFKKTPDNKLDTFRRICDEIAEERSYINKAKILEQFLKKGSNKKEFEGDTLLWVQMLIPGDSQRVYNLQNKQMLKLFARLFACDQNDMQQQLEQDGDVSLTLCKYFEESSKLKPQNESTLYLQDVEAMLSSLEKRTKEDEQSELLQKFCKQATALDLRTFIRLIKQDLRINAKAKHILDALTPNAYQAYQTTRDLAAVVKEFTTKKQNPLFEVNKKSPKKAASKIGQVQVMTPISPMLANACKSVEEALKKSPGGLYSEIKYDGERVQIHKKDNEFKFFSRNLKPVMEHKVKRFKEYIPKAFPGVGELILDSEIILVDTNTGELLPFGTLGVNKKKELSHTEVCLFVFDCLLYNGDDLTNLTFRERRKVLENQIQPIKSYVQLSECHFLKTKNELSLMTAKVLKANLEGVVLKSPSGTYQPGKRGWLKVKKDYLFGGKMADTADLVVLGAWFGSGKKGGVLSIFLMGCYDKRDHLWKTVTKVHSGLDDSTNDSIHNELMQLMERADPNRTPNWLLCKKALVPDYLAKKPTEMPVWEITGAEFTKSEAHTAAGISIRFPRITKLRPDKSAMQANDLEYLQKLYEASKSDVNVDLLMAGCEEEDMLDAVEIDSKLNLQMTPQKRQSGESKTSTSKKVKKERVSLSGDEEENLVKLKNDSKPPKRQLSSEEEAEANLSKKLPGSMKKQKIEPSPQKMKLKTEPKKETSKQVTLDFFKTTKTSPNLTKTEVKEELVEPCSESTLFKAYTAYFDKSLEDIERYTRDFVANGGVVSEDSTKAQLAFYESDRVDIDIDYCRAHFKRTCRHISIAWLKKSLEEKKCEEYALYAVILKDISKET